jgi:hypothetical protein
MPRRTPVFRLLKDAQAFVLAHREEGVHCPCCGLSVKVSRRNIYNKMAITLLYLVEERLQNGPEWIDIQKILRKVDWRGGDYALMEYWGFIERPPKDPENDDPTKAPGRQGLWRATAEGIAYVCGDFLAPKAVFTCNKEVLGWTDEQVSFLECLPETFDYRNVQLRPQDVSTLKLAELRKRGLTDDRYMRPALEGRDRGHRI